MSLAPRFLVVALAVFVGTGCRRGAPADLIVVNADIRTVDVDRPRAAAFAVRNGRFVAVGSRSDAEQLAGPETHVIDANGATILPGFVDGHVHLESGISLGRR